MSFTKKPKNINPDEVDPSVYYYDEVYDEEKPKSPKQDVRQGSKYIQGLKETAELRKTEKEIRKFKRYTRDREDANPDEDIYITSAYKKKLKEVSELGDEKIKKRFRENHEKSELPEECTSTSRTQKSSNDLTVTLDRDIETCDQDSKLPKTIEERRVYLKQILAKRTIGKVYDEAVQRYIQRKSTNNPIKY